ncbi:MAG TPA: hypothetical protein VKD04_15085, partial [Burkholderiales bacterium]|nr:hypothetical protein [Burkholderiales bacterium]
EFLEDNAGTIGQESFALCRRVLKQVVEKIGMGYFSPPLAFDDPRWTSYRLAEVLPLELEEKQSLLALRNDGERLRHLYAYLQQAA